MWTDSEKSREETPESAFLRFMEDRHQGAGHADKDDGRGLGDCAGGVRRRTVGASEPGHDDRKFLEALHYFTVHSVTWRTLPAEFGKWNSIWKRFWRLSRSGVFEAFLQLLAETSKSAQVIQFSERHRRCLVHRLAHPNDGQYPDAKITDTFNRPPSPGDRGPARRKRHHEGFSM